MHLGLDDPTSPEALQPLARISGIQRPEFTEPTPRKPPIRPSAGAKAQFTGISSFITRSADKIPDNLFSFRATPEVRTIAQLFGRRVLLPVGDGANDGSEGQ
jgi:hypothetical protein